LKFHLASDFSPVQNVYAAYLSVLSAKCAVYFAVLAAKVCFFDGYDAKLTIKNYAKLCKISTDTAARDIHDLEGKGVLRVAQGRVRDASYSPVYSHDVLQYEHLTTAEHDGKYYISATLSNHRIIEERIFDIDWLRFSQKEVSHQDLGDNFCCFSPDILSAPEETPLIVHLLLPYLLFSIYACVTIRIFLCPNISIPLFTL